MKEKETRRYRGGGYGELEAEIISKRTTQILYNKKMEEAGYDPRILASRAEAEARGFDMNMDVDYQTTDNNQNG